MLNNFTCEKEYSSCDVILPGEEGRGALLLGDINSATDEELLSKHDVKTVITTAVGMNHLEIPSSATHIVYPLRDANSENIRTYFDESFITIDRKLNEGGVLVHCAAGVSRSATIIIAYIMRKNQLGFKSAISLVRAKRSGVCPNLGFEMQLKKYETDLLGKEGSNSKQMKKMSSEKMAEQQKEDTQPNKIQNRSFFEFPPNFAENSTQISKKKPEVKRGVPSKYKGFTRPKERPIFEVGETELFVSGKAAKRPSSQICDEEEKASKGRKNIMIGTWGPMHQKMKPQYKI